ncbi:MAG: shikimate dehydrogenase family protein [Anaerotardibacter sp.]
MANSDKVFLLGHPVAHSKSPVTHNAAYKLLGIPWTYELADRAEEKDAIDFLQAADFVGINITTPYKPLAFQYSQKQDPSAVLAGGANVLVKTDEGLIAYNTDGKGVIWFLKYKGVNFDGAKVIVCGTGPTSHAITNEALEAGASVHMLGRDAERSKAKVAEYLQKRIDLGLEDFTGKLEGNSYEAAQDTIKEADIIIDATVLGMKEGDPAAFDVALLNDKQVVMDVVYGHGVTAINQGAQDAGATFYDGGGMLVAQAVETIRIWAEANGIEPSCTWDKVFEEMVRAGGFENIL